MPQTYYTATPDPTSRFQCRHIFPDGHRCASPCLRQEELCYYHHTTRRPIANPRARIARTATFTLPNPADLIDRSGIQLAIAEVLHRIAANDIDPRRAGLLLYGLQIASLNLPKQPLNPPAAILVDDTTEDPILGTLAPRARIVDLEPKSQFQLAIEEMDARHAAEEEAKLAAAEEARLAAEEAAKLAAAEEAALAQPEPLTLPTLQATAAESTPNPNPLRSLLRNPPVGPSLT